MANAPSTGREPGGRLSRWADRHASSFLLAPLALVVAAVVVYPLGYSLWASFVDYDTSTAHPWVGLRNYRAVVEYSSFPAALTRTAGLCCVAVAIEFTLGLLLALSVAGGGRWRRRLIPLLVLPAVAGAVTAGLLWRLFLDAAAGPVGFLLGELGRPVSEEWLSNPWITYAGIVLADAWQWTPVVFLILYAGLRTIPSELYEAADLDGATPRRSFAFVTLPLLAPFAVLALLLRLVDAMKLFDVPAIFGGTSEATETAAVYLYDQGFTYFHLGFASAGSWLFVLAIAVVACPLLVLLLRRRAQWA